MGRKPYVDQEVCVSCQLCVETVPEVFRMNDDNFAEAYNPAGAPDEKIQEAIDACPVNCIRWE